MLRKVGCSLVGMKQRVEKKEGKWRLVLEGGESGGRKGGEGSGDRVCSDSR
jgi:hypothetical protein